MDDFIELEKARVIASRFIQSGRCDCENPDPNGPQLSEIHHEYRLGERAVAYEFPLNKDRMASGYLVISGSRAFQPILEYSTTGNSLRNELTHGLNGLISRLGVGVKSVQWFYCGPLDIVAEIKKIDGGYLYARIPNLKYFESTRQIILPIKAQRDKKWISEQWRIYESQDFPQPSLPCSKMFGVEAPLYNQTCYGSLLGVETTNAKNYCTPQCIVGCVATAWAMLAGAWEGLLGTGKIYADSPGWKADWQSSYGSPPPPGNEGVNRHMWKVNSYMGTTCAGNTNNSNAISGSRLFGDFGINWYWGSRDGVDYGFSAQINKYGQPFLLTAQSTWVPGEVDGHGVVVHGYNDNDCHLYISRGWGSAFPDVWIAFSSLSQVSVYFRANPPASAQGDTSETALPFVLQ